MRSVTFRSMVSNPTPIIDCCMPRPCSSRAARSLAAHSSISSSLTRRALLRLPRGSSFDSNVSGTHSSTWRFVCWHEGPIVFSSPMNFLSGRGFCAEGCSLRRGERVAPFRLFAICRRERIARPMMASHSQAEAFGYRRDELSFVFSSNDLARRRCRTLVLRPFLGIRVC